MLFILGFLAFHWFLSLFFHSFFLHRFASHQMYITSKRWEKFFYFMTFFSQGSSFLVPKAYAVMHRMHHTYSDTEKDPHSPHFFRDIIQMMIHTYKIFEGFHLNKSFYEAYIDAPFNTKKPEEPKPLSQEEFIKNVFGNSKQA